MTLRAFYMLIIGFSLVNCSAQIQRGTHEYRMNYEIPANSTLTLGNKSGELYRVLLHNLSDNEISYSFNKNGSASLQPGDSTHIDARLKAQISLSNATDKASKVKVVVSDNKDKLKTTIRKN